MLKYNHNKKEKRNKLEVKIMLEKGMKVKVRNDLEVGNFYGGVMFNAYMNLFKGKEVTILQHSRLFCIDVYYIEERANSPWTEDMFEPIEENPMPKLESGMFVKNKSGNYGVVVKDRIIYDTGGYDIVSAAIRKSGYIRQVIEDNYGFNNLKNGKIIWEYKVEDKKKEKEKEKPKTYFEDFVEKYSRFQKTKNTDDYKYICAGLCYNFTCPNNTPCADCWNAPKGKWNK